jgi:medium-chain acyl-[acyl-carrier-protein] hydrolase
MTPADAVRAGAPNRWIAAPGARTHADLRLVCLPSAGGGTIPYRAWARHLPATIEVCPVQLPGREIRIAEPPLTNFSAMVDALAAGLAQWLDERPFALFGHSMGALLAFALARQRRRAGRSAPLMLIVSGHDAPASPSTFPRCSEMSDADLLRWLRRLGGTPDAAFDVPELVDLVLRTTRADLMICDSFVHTVEPPLACPILAFGGADDPYTSPDGMEAWRRETSAPFSACFLPGSHFFVRSSERDLLAAIGRALQPASRTVR